MSADGQKISISPRIIDAIFLAPSQTTKPRISRAGLQRLLTKDWLPQLLEVAAKHGLDSKTIVPFAIACFERSQYRFKVGYVKAVDQSEFDLISLVKEANAKNPRFAASTETLRSTASQLQQARKYVRLLIASFQEVLDYDPVRFHNQPPPALRIEDQGYLNEVRNIVAELQKLNKLLASRKSSGRQIKSKATALGRYFDEFFNSYAKAMGKVMATLTGGAVVALLYHSGVGKELLDSIWGHLKLPK